MVGKLQRVPLREVWPREAQDFTTWLEDNIDVLNDVIDMNLSSAEREQAAGSFSVDILAEDDSGNTIVIENQLEKSNHDHLGKLITYLSNLDANIAIWIVSEPRLEHINAINWLNEAALGAFYLLKVEAIRIGESEPAPLLTLIVGPSEEGREIGETKKERAERYFIRERFWTQLLDRAKEITSTHANVSPSQGGWVGAGAGKSGMRYVYTIGKNKSGVELYIDRGKESKEENKHIFDQLFASKDSIEESFGDPIDWERLDERRASRIRKQFQLGGFIDEDNWPDIQSAMIDAMDRLDKALRPHIDRLKI